MRMAKLSLTLQNASTALDLPNRSQFRTWISAALGKQSAEITLRIVDTDEGQCLNRTYRNKDYPTNVLTFIFDDLPANLPLTGDIILCAPVVMTEAAQQQKTTLAHYAHLTIHGVLHLQGFDHENEADAQRMESRERDLLQQLGFPDPYGHEENSRTLD